MPNAAPIAIALAGIGIVLVERGVPQALWNAATAARSPVDVPAQPLAVPSGGGITSGTGVSFGGALTSAEQAAAAAGPSGLGKVGDWWNWCLNWVNQTFTNAGLRIPALGLRTANDACGALNLNPSTAAPYGAIVCYKDNASGHIGISQGNGTYASAGLVHGSGVSGITVNPIGGTGYAGFYLP